MDEELKCCGDRPSRPQVVENPIVARRIIINPMQYGYVVEVGCQSFAIEKLSDVIKGIEAYLQDPDVTEKTWTLTRKLPL